jgi:outer membrane immunogenic protein
MKSIYLAAIAAGMLTTAAQAADLPPRPAPVPYQAPVVVAPLFTWTGFYIGGNIGGGWFNGSVDSDFGSTWSTSTGAFMGGGQLGFNYQWGAFVFGLESEFDWTSGHRSTDFVDTPFLLPNNLLKSEAKWDWLITVAARLGYAVGRSLFYGKVGYAWSRVSVNLVNTLDSSPSCCGSGNTNSGWLLGAGFEYAFTTNWTGKIEYEYINLSHRTFTLDPTIITGGPFSITVAPILQVVKAGVNYKFGFGY